MVCTWRWMHTSDRIETSSLGWIRLQHTHLIWCSPGRVCVCVCVCVCLIHTAYSCYTSGQRGCVVCFLLCCQYETCNKSMWRLTHTHTHTHTQKNTMLSPLIESHLTVLCFSLGYATAEFWIVSVLFLTGRKTLTLNRGSSHAERHTHARQTSTKLENINERTRSTLQSGSH